MTFKELVKQLQTAMNTFGENLTVDGDAGPRTTAALARFHVELKLEKLLIVRPESPFQDFGAPWVFANIDLLGKMETDPDLNARYVPEWSKEGLPGFKSLSGDERAWCSLRVNADFRKVGVAGTNSAGASSWSSWGKRSPYWFGSVLDIRHNGGGRHVCNFLYWIDEQAGIAATLDGNRGNRFAVCRTPLKSLSGDRVQTGPRWSKDWPDGQIVSMAEVLAAHPNLAVTGGGSVSTR